MLFVFQSKVAEGAKHWGGGVIPHGGWSLYILGQITREPNTASTTHCVIIIGCMQSDLLKFKHTQ